MKETNGGKPQGLSKPVSNLAFFADTAMTVEGARVAAAVRLAHLLRNDRTDSDTQELLKRTQFLENFVDGKLRERVLTHPTAPWWTRVRGPDGKGLPLQVMGKLIGHIENFGRYYPAGDPMIPAYVTRTPVPDEEKNLWVWVDGIERLVTPGKLHKYAGVVPGQKLEEGKLAGFNTDLRMTLFRLVQFGFFFTGNSYYDFYVKYKGAKQRDIEERGVKILPTPKGRFCPICLAEKKVPRTTFRCPDCGAKLGKKDEPAGVIWEGHLDYMARRRAAKLFLDHLWFVWRDALKLPTREPYPVEYLGHSTIIRPEDMCSEKEATVAVA